MEPESKLAHDSTHWSRPGTVCTLSSVAPAVGVNLPNDLVGSIDREVAAGRYETREEFVRRAVESLLARERIEPAEGWTGDTRSPAFGAGCSATSLRGRCGLELTAHVPRERGDVLTVDFPVPGRHPAVVISDQVLINSSTEVVVSMSTARVR